MARILNKQQVYNQERALQNKWAKQELDDEKLLQGVIDQTIQSMQDKIDKYYIDYANSEGITRAEANKRIKDFDVQAWAEKAAKAVHEKDFSPETNKWLKTYNRKMYITRAELIKAELEIELQYMYSEAHALIDKRGMEIALEELKRQSGILGRSTGDTMQMARDIVNADFYGNPFSERIWSRTGYYQDTRKQLFASLNNMNVDMMGYRAERERIKAIFNTTDYEVMRLLKTETARIRADAEIKSANDNGATHFIFITEKNPCKRCEQWNMKAIPYENLEKGYNFPTLHPYCRCHVRNHIQMEYKDGRTTLDEFEIVSGLPEDEPEAKNKK